PGLQVRMSKTPGEVGSRQGGAERPQSGVPSAAVGSRAVSSVGWADRSTSEESASIPVRDRRRSAADTSESPLLPTALPALAGVKVLDLCIVLAGPTCG